MEDSKLLEQSLACWMVLPNKSLALFRSQRGSAIPNREFQWYCATGVLLAWSFSTTPGDTFPPRAPTRSQVIAKHILGMILKKPSIPGSCKEAFSFFLGFRTPPPTVEEEHRKAMWGSEKARGERWVYLVALPPKTAGQLPFESVIHFKPL